VVFDFHPVQKSLSHSLSRPQESNLTVAKEFVFSLRDEPPHINIKRKCTEQPRQRLFTWAGAFEAGKLNHTPPSSSADINTEVYIGAA
jgi:hypothetical protein